MGFLSAALAGLLGVLSAILIKHTTSVEFRNEHKFLELILWFFYITTFPISMPIGFGYLLVKYLKNKNPK